MCSLKRKEGPSVSIFLLITLRMLIYASLGTYICWPLMACREFFSPPRKILIVLMLQLTKSYADFYNS